MGIKFQLKPIAQKLRDLGFSITKIAEVLECSRTYTGQILKSSEPDIGSAVDDILGPEDQEFLRVKAVHRCMEVLSGRGWFCAETDPKCVFDVLAYKDGKTRKIQVKSSATIKDDTAPQFNIGRIRFNTSRTQRDRYVEGDFDYWFFYYKNGDCWLIPFDEVHAVSSVRMIGFNKFYVG